MAFKTNFLNVYHLFNEASISAFYFTIFLKIMPQTSILWADISNICRYIIIFTWALNVLIVLIENLVKVIEKLKEYLHNKRNNNQVLPVVNEKVVEKSYRANFNEATVHTALDTEKQVYNIVRFKFN